MMRILVTGATGFIGSEFCAYALENGHEIYALARSPGSPGPNLENHPGYTFIAFDLFNPEKWLLPKIHFDACLHCAWITEPGVFWDSEENDYYLTASKKFFMFLLEQYPQLYLCSLGSCAEYKVKGGPFTESDPVAGISRYTSTKIELSEFLFTLSPNSGWARIFYPYGPGESTGRLLITAIERFALKRTILLNSPSSVKDYIYVTDVASALLKILEQQICGSVNIGTGIGVSLLDLLECVQSQMHESNLIVAGGACEENRQDTVADISRLLETGWRPKVTMDRGLGSLINWIHLRNSDH